MAQLLAELNFDATPSPLALNLDGFEAAQALAEALDRIVVEPINPIDRQCARFGARALQIRGVLSAAECAYLVDTVQVAVQLAPVRGAANSRRSERAVFLSDQLASILEQRLAPTIEREIGSVRVVRPGPVSRDACVQQYPVGGEPAEAPEELQLPYGHEGDWCPNGLNKCFGFHQYKAGGFFRAHCDGEVYHSDDERSLYTCILYLDGPCDGGRTRFLKPNMELTDDVFAGPSRTEDVLAEVLPEPGLCLLFFQNGLLHEGEDLHTGVKTILRTDLMFQRVEGTRPPRTDAQKQAWTLLMEAQRAEGSRDFKLSMDLYRRAFKLDPDLEKIC